MKLKAKTGIMQDATFITSDPGHAGKDRPRGDEAKTRRSKDGAWAKRKPNPISVLSFMVSWIRILA